MQPSNSKIIFEKFSLDGIELSAKKTKEYEDEFEDKVIQEGDVIDLKESDFVDKDKSISEEGHQN